MHSLRSFRTDSHEACVIGEEDCRNAQSAAPDAQNNNAHGSCHDPWALLYFLRCISYILRLGSYGLGFFDCIGLDGHLDVAGDLAVQLDRHMVLAELLERVFE